MQNSPSSVAASGTLEGFVAEIAGEDRFRIEEDLGLGYVRLKSSEAERRQAAQDIRSSEDIVIELLRNSRDAGAKNIFVAMQKDAVVRNILVADDGSGIPPEMHESVFQPRVTSKLDSAHMDRWGIHGRGMALYSVSVNSIDAKVAYSEPGRGSVISVSSDTRRVPEKTDQSAFPRFEKVDEAYAMRGPKNILRTIAEFAFEHRDSINVYCGSATEVVATLCRHGVDTVDASTRLFDPSAVDSVDCTQLPGLAADAEQLANMAAKLGFDISTRSARRILDGEIEPLPTIMTRIERESFPGNAIHAKRTNARSAPYETCKEPPASRKRLAGSDVDDLAGKVRSAFSEIAEKYYLADVEPKMSQKGGKIHIELDLIDAE